MGGCQCRPNSCLLQYHGEPRFVLRACTEENISFKMRCDVLQVTVTGEGSLATGGPAKIAAAVGIPGVMVSEGLSYSQRVWGYCG